MASEQPPNTPFSSREVKASLARVLHRAPEGEVNPADAELIAAVGTRLASRLAKSAKLPGCPAAGQAHYGRRLTG